MPRHVLHGRVRLSTVLTALVFVVALVTYLIVRPLPAYYVKHPYPNMTSSPTLRPSKSASPAPSPSPPSPSPSPSPSAVVSPSRPPIAAPPSARR